MAINFFGAILHDSWSHSHYNPTAYMAVQSVTKQQASSIVPTNATSKDYGADQAVTVPRNSNDR